MVSQIQFQNCEIYEGKYEIKIKGMVVWLILKVLLVDSELFKARKKTLILLLKSTRSPLSHFELQKTYFLLQKGQFSDAKID